MKRIVLFGVGIVVVVAAILVLANVYGEPGGEQINPESAGGQAKNYNVKGSEQASVEIIEYSDFECSFCAKFWKQTLPQIEKDYIETGKARLVYRHFPLAFHSRAGPAALAAECAGEQGKFWEMHDKIYSEGTLGEASYKKWAAGLGLDEGQFNSCFDSGKYNNKVQNDLLEGKSAGVTGTPTFFINGKKVVGAQPFEVFQGVIEQELSK